MAIDDEGGRLTEALKQELCRDIVIKHHECGAGGFLKLKDLLDYFQDIAAEHAQELGVGVDTVGKKRELWVLSRLKLGILRDVNVGERLRLLTYPSGLDLLFAVRQFSLFDISGKLVVKGTSYWLLLDRETFHPMRPALCLPEGLLSVSRDSHYESLGKLRREAEACKECGRTVVRQSDLDLNNHLNNAQYGRYIADVASELMGAPARFAELQINYNHQAVLGNQIIGAGHVRNDGMLYVEGHDEKGSVCYFQALGRMRG